MLGNLQMNRQKYAAETEVSLPSLRKAPPQPLRYLTSKTTVKSKLFLQNIRKYNSCLQTTWQILCKNRDARQRLKSEGKYITKQDHCHPSPVKTRHFCKYGKYWCLRLISGVETDLIMTFQNEPTGIIINYDYYPQW